MNKVSAPALNAARAVLKKYSLDLRPETAAKGMTASEAHVAIVIDNVTNIYQIAQLRPELFYWLRRLHGERAEKIRVYEIYNFLHKLLETFATVPQRKPDEPALYWEESVELEKSALQAVRYLEHYYVIRPQKERAYDPPEDRIRLALIIQGASGIRRALEAVPLARLYADRLANDMVSAGEVRALFKQLSVRLEFLPNYADRTEEMVLPV